jgi:hypothetical protein
MELLFVHYTAKPKIGNQQIGVVLWSSEQEILGLQIAMDNSMVVEVSHG